MVTPDAPRWRRPASLAGQVVLPRSGVTWAKCARTGSKWWPWRSSFTSTPVLHEPVSITPTLARRIEIWPVGRLVPYAKNARTHSPEQVAQIAASIVEFGFNAPILVDSNAGIVAGHGRLLAARKLGLQEVPVVVLDHLTETQRRAYIIADNKLALNAGWDEAVLAAELGELERDGLDLAVVGFSDDELQALLASGEEAAEAATEAEEDIPEPPAEPISRPGDIWTIGRHRLICGDCRDMAVIRALFAELAGTTGSKMPGSRSFTSLAGRRSNSGRRQSATFPRTASITRRTIPNRLPAAVCWARVRVARRRDSQVRVMMMAVSPALRAHRT